MTPEDVSLDVACGPGSVVVAFARACAEPPAWTTPRPCSIRRGSWQRGALSRRPSRWRYGAVQVSRGGVGGGETLVAAPLAGIERMCRALKLAYARKSELRELPASIRSDFNQAGHLRPAQRVFRRSVGAVGIGLAHD